jgi:hypothetical protein
MLDLMSCVTVLLVLSLAAIGLPLFLCNKCLKIVEAKQGNLILHTVLFFALWFGGGIAGCCVGPRLSYHPADVIAIVYAGALAGAFTSFVLAWTLPQAPENPHSYVPHLDDADYRRRFESRPLQQPTASEDVTAEPDDHPQRDDDRLLPG